MRRAEKKEKVVPITEEFLYKIYAYTLKDSIFCAKVCEYMRESYLPNAELKRVHNFVKDFYLKYKTKPSIDLMRQEFGTIERGMVEVVEAIEEADIREGFDAIVDMLERYIKMAYFQKKIIDMGKAYTEGNTSKVQEIFYDTSDWLMDFSMKPSSFVQVTKDLKQRCIENRQRAEEAQANDIPSVTSFYLPPIDALNRGQNLRTQLSCFMASTGVGKSHIAKHIGLHACLDSDLNVLHIQLEGSQEECINAYSGALAGCNARLFGKGYVKAEELEEVEDILSSTKGSIYIKTFPRFNTRVSTVDIQTAISEFKKETGRRLDLIIIDSMDLLEDASGTKWDATHLRHKRVAVAQDLKDLAADENVWIVVTYQSTIENKEWIDDENNVLTEFNCAEAKGITRPMSHLISLNQSSNERDEETMRLHIAKSRFFRKGDTFKIATDYEHEVFYDAERSLTMEKIEHVKNTRAKR